jgi:hypothetical protein
MRRLADWYDSRIVNVNVNILVAGAVALLITMGFMHTLEKTGLLEALQRAVGLHRMSIAGREIHAEKLVVSGLTLIVDLIADVAVYYGLHWLANHMPRSTPRKRNGAYAKLSFMRDATLVQFERALISPVLYIVALGIQNFMLHRGFGVAIATGAGFTAGILLSRVLHTMWMIHAERIGGRHSAADIVGPDKHPPESPV